LKVDHLKVIPEESKQIHSHEKSHLYVAQGDMTYLETTAFDV